MYTCAQGDTNEYDADWLSDHGVKVIRDKAEILLPTPRVKRILCRLIKESGVEGVVFGAAAPLALLAPSLRAAGAKNVIAITHGHEVWWAKLLPFKLLIRRIGSTTDAMTYLGEFTRTAISKPLTSQAASRMVKIAPGIDTDHFRPVDSTQLRNSLGLQEKKVVVSVGRLVHRKGQDYLIKAMPMVLARIPNAHLLIVGEGPYRSHLQTLVAKYQLDASVSFIGRIQFNDLPYYLCAGDVFAMPSRSRFFGLEVEGLGIVYLEASACGLPVIAGASGGAPDALLEGVTGVVVNGRDTSAIAGAVIALLNDLGSAQKMGRAGREWITENWRWSIWSQRFNRILEV